ncbi:MAG: hypothetical protein ACI3YC_01080 [Alloprevotella sp.]
MKRTLYLLCLLLCGAVHATAQQSKRQLRMPIPGVDIRQLHGNARHDAAKKEAREAKPAMTGRCQVRLVKPEQRAAAVNKTDVYVKKSLPISWEYKFEDLRDASNNTSSTKSIAYDKFGNFQTIDYGDYKDVYAYEYATGRKWTKKTVSRVEGTESRVTNQELRTLDTAGRVLTIKRYESVQVEEGIYNLVLVEEKEYEYTHVAEGILVKEISYNSWEPTEIQWQTFRKWCDPLQAYVECESGYGGRMELSVEADKYVIKTFSYDYENKTYADTPSKLEEHYFTADGRDGGYYSATYSDSGDIYYEQGEKYLYTDDAPQAGYTTRITQEIDDYGNTGWVNKKKEEYSNNFDDPMIPGSGNRYRKQYNYDSDAAAWVLEYDIRNEWTAQGFMREEWNSYLSDGSLNWTDVEMWKYDNEGNELGYVYPFNNGGYVLETESDVLNEDVSYYTYYDANGNVTKRLKLVANDEKTSATLGDFTPYELKNGAWVMVTGSFTIGDGAGRLEAEFDSKGRIVKSEEYDQNAQLSVRRLYTYTANGYTEEKYEQIDEYFFKSQTSGISIDNDGTLSDWYIYYNVLGNTMGGYKYETYADGRHISYSYNDTTGEFVRSGAYVENLETVAADGTRTVIYRELDSNGNIVETGKVISNYEDTTSLYERYTKEDGKWVGVEKRESFSVTRPTFDVNPITDPLEIHDEYFFPNDDDDVSPSALYSTHYAWVDDAWVVRRSNTCSYTLEGNTLTQAVTYINNDPASGSSEKETDIFVTTRDDKHNVVAQSSRYEQTRKSEYSNYFHGSKHDFAYEYNSENQLTRQTITIYQDETGDGLVAWNRETITYNYELCDVVDGITPIDGSNSDALRLNGRTLSANGAELTVYAADGTRVAQGKQVNLPAAGIYIVTNGSSRSKVAVK